MGIEVTYRRIPKSEFELLQTDPKRAEEFVCSVLPGFSLDDLIALGDNPDATRDTGVDVLAAFQNRENDPTRVDLEKDWHALHFLLTGDSSMETAHRPGEPFRNVVMGGREANFQTGYGPARWFDPEDINDIAGALTKISVEDLRARFSAEAFNEAEIYPRPRPGGWDEEEVEGVYDVFPKLVRFFEQAAAAEEVVILYAI
jgi:hypothetical protein